MRTKKGSEWSKELRRSNESVDLYMQSYKYYDEKEEGKKTEDNARLIKGMLERRLDDAEQKKKSKYQNILDNGVVFGISTIIAIAGFFILKNFEYHNWVGVGSSVGMLKYGYRIWKDFNQYRDASEIIEMTQKSNNKYVEILKQYLPNTN